MYLQDGDGGRCGAPVADMTQSSKLPMSCPRPCRLCPCSGKTVTVTLWGTAAEAAGAELEALTHPLVSLSSCRVTDYNGATGPCCGDSL